MSVFDFAFVVVIKFISQFGVQIIFWLAFSLVAFCLADLQNKICFLCTLLLVLNSILLFLTFNSDWFLV